MRSPEDTERGSDAHETTFAHETAFQRIQAEEEITGKTVVIEGKPSQFPQLEHGEVLVARLNYGFIVGIRYFRITDLKEMRDVWGIHGILNMTTEPPEFLIVQEEAIGFFKQNNMANLEDMEIDESSVYDYRGVSAHQTRNKKTGKLNSTVVLRREGHEDATAIIDVKKTIADSVDQVRDEIDSLLDQE